MQVLNPVAYPMMMRHRLSTVYEMPTGLALWGNGVPESAPEELRKLKVRRP